MRVEWHRRVGMRGNRRGGASRAPSVGTPTYMASGFSDANYFAGANSQGRDSLGTVRLVGTMYSVPTNATKIIAQRCDASGVLRGWYLGTGVGGAAGCIMLVACGSGNKISPAFQFSPTDLEQLFVLHATVDSSFVRLYMNGVEVGDGTATGVANTPAQSTEYMTIGRHRSTGLSVPHVGVAALHATASVMDAAEVAADAAAIMAATSRLEFPALPSQDVAYVASDLVSVTDWHDRAGDDATLTRNGTITLTEVT